MSNLDISNKQDIPKQKQSVEDIFALEKNKLKRFEEKNPELFSHKHTFI